MDQQRRLVEMLDKADIIDRKHAYLRAADAIDPERMVAQFTADCVASYDAEGPLIEGRDALHHWYATRLTHIVASSHHASNFEITFTDPDTALLRCYLYSWQRFDDFPTTADRHRFARYIDTWVRREDEWYQQSLTCLVAGEYCSDAPPRIGEYFDWDR